MTDNKQTYMDFYKPEVPPDPEADKIVTEAYNELNHIMRCVICRSKFTRAETIEADGCPNSWCAGLLSDIMFVSSEPTPEQDRADDQENEDIYLSLTR